MACAIGLGAAGAASCGGQTHDQPTGPIAAGNVSDMPPGAFKVMGDVVLVRDDRGLYAMSTVCTHAGCITQENGSGGLSCPCHGARFDRDGKVLGGPAPRPLPHFAVEMATDGSLTVQASSIVSADTRMPVRG